MKGVREGLHALRAVVRAPGSEISLVESLSAWGSERAVVAAGFADLDVRTASLTNLSIVVRSSARITGRFLYNGEEAPDPGRTQVTVLPEGDDAHLRGGLASSPEWHANAAFELEGVFGESRLVLRTGEGWYVQSASLEDGTDIASAPFAFEPGKTYRNVRVALSNEGASIDGAIPPEWRSAPQYSIVAFPEEPALRSDRGQYVRQIHVQQGAERFSIRTLPPGHAYLVVAIRNRTGFVTSGTGAGDILQERLDELEPIATRVFVSSPGPVEVRLPPGGPR